MKRLFLVVAVLAILITSIFASQTDPRKPLSLRDNTTKPVTQNSRFAPTYSFAIEPISIVDNFYDYFPGSYTGKPMQRVQTPTLDGHWLVFHTKTTSSSNRRVYKTFIDNTGNILANSTFGTTVTDEGYASVDVTEGGRPMLAFHTNLDEESEILEVGFGYDAVIQGVLLNMNSDLYNIIDNPIDIEVNGTTVSTNQFIWPSVQVGPSPVAGSQRVYVMAKNAETNGAAVSENVIIFYKDFTETEIETQAFDGTGWEHTTIPQMDEWNTSPVEWRRPFMSFVAHEDKLYYIGYHLAYEDAVDYVTIPEGTITAFVCDNYGEGEWMQYSTFAEFEATNGQFIDPNTGEFIDGAYFEDYTNEQLSIVIGQSGHFSTGVDTEGKIHFPAFYTLGSNEGTYYPGLHTIKSLAFDTNTFEWTLAEVYPQQDNGSEPFIPNDPIDITQYDSQDLYPVDSQWLWWDQDGDGQYDEILDDGTWDGNDDGVTEADVEYWGMPLLSTIWPYMYWDTTAADDAMMFHLHTAHITDANEYGMMAMVWQDSEKARLGNTYPDDYPEYVPYANMCDIVISVSADNGEHWSEPFSLNGIDTPEMQDEIPEFPYLGSKVDYIGTDEDGNLVGRVHVMYLDDNTFGSSVQLIGQPTGGAMKYMALDVTFTNAPVEINENDVAPSVAMLNQNYPNPFNPTTTISYNVTKAGDVKLKVYNVKGQLVKTLVNSTQNVGLNQVVWNGDDNDGNKVSSGVYYYKLENAGRSEMKKMVLMK